MVVNAANGVLINDTPEVAGPLTATASVVKLGRNVVHLESRVTGDSGRLVASSAGSFAILHP